MKLAPSISLLFMILTCAHGKASGQSVTCGPPACYPSSQVPVKNCVIVDIQWDENLFDAFLRSSCSLATSTSIPTLVCVNCQPGECNGNETFCGYFTDRDGFCSLGPSAGVAFTNGAGGCFLATTCGFWETCAAALVNAPSNSGSEMITYIDVRMHAGADCSSWNICHDEVVGFAGGLALAAGEYEFVPRAPNARGASQDVWTVSLGATFADFAPPTDQGETLRR